MMVDRSDEVGRNSLRDTAISSAQEASPTGNWGRIEGAFELNIDVAAGATNTVRPLTSPTSSTPKEEAVPQPTQVGFAGVSSALFDDTLVPARDARNYLTDALDSLRRTEEAVRTDKPRFMMLARRFGFTNVEIGELLGITEAAVRGAIKRAKGTPGTGFTE